MNSKVSSIGIYESTHLKQVVMMKPFWLTNKLTCKLSSSLLGVVGVANAKCQHKVLAKAGLHLINQDWISNAGSSDSC